MSPEKARAKLIERYMRLLRAEVDRFLSRACCHACALGVWHEWREIENAVAPHLSSGMASIHEVNLAAICAFMANVCQKADVVQAKFGSEPAVNGKLIDELYTKHKGEVNEIMHEFVRMPMTPSPGQKPAKRAKKIEFTIKGPEEMQ